jgi:hypothetical protein
MRNFVITALTILILTVSANAGQTIQECNNCRITYQTQKRVVKQYVPVAPAVPMVPVGRPIPDAPYVTSSVPIGPAPISTAPVVVPTYSYVPTPEVSNIYTPPGYPSDIPVATNATGSCAMYVDPYDLFGQLFGGADLVQSCWTRLY